MTTPTFTSATYSLSLIPSSLVLADLTNDGDLDIVMSDDPAVFGSTTYAGGFTVMMGNGNGTFQTAVNYTDVVATDGATVVPYLFPQSIATAVLSKGAAPSIIAADRNGAVAVLSNYTAPTANSLGGWGSVVEYTPATSGILYPNAVTTGALTSNGEQDIVVAEGSGNVAVLMNNGAGGFGVATSYADGTDAAQVTLADMNGDGVLDAITVDGVTGAVSILNGDNSFGGQSGTFGFDAPTVIGTLAAGSASYSVTTALINGKTDIIVANINGGVTIYTPATAKSESGFTSQSYVVGSGPISVATADVNGDGVLDLIVAENSPGAIGSSVDVLLGNGDGTFGSPIALATGGTPDAVAVGNLGNGKTDIVYTNSNNYANATVGVLLNTTVTSLPTPTITGTAAGQTTFDYYAIAPFSKATIGNVTAGASLSLTITTDGANGATTANGLLSGAGLTSNGGGVYTLTATGATAAATLIGELDALKFTPTQHEVAAGKTVTTTFSLALTETANGLSATATNATASVATTALNYITGSANGGSCITGTTGTDVITAFGYYNTINANGGNDVINAGAGNACVNAGGGNVTVTLGGSWNSVSGTNGNDTVTGASGGYTSVSLGNGCDTVQIGGQHDTITLGNGGDLVTGTQGMSFITTGSGNDTIVLAGSGNTVNAGNGNNAITAGSGCDNSIVVCSPGQGVDTISGFSETNGDVLNLASALSGAGYNGFLGIFFPPLANYLKVTDVGGNTDIAIASNGCGNGTTVAVLQGVSYGLNDLVCHNSLIVC